MAKSIEQFDPQDSKYKQLGDLPKKQRKQFESAENGFIRKSFEKDPEAARSLAEVQNIYMEDILRLKKEGKNDEAAILEEEMATALRDFEKEQK